MPRRPDLPCNRCGKLMWRGTGVLPVGKARCRECRAVEAQPSGARARRHERSCENCGEEFTYPSAKAGQRFCSRLCASRWAGAARRVRHPDDPRVRRQERRAAAPGLTTTQMDALRAKWIRQARSCAYCPRRATSIDHVLPLVRGGTNYEGNLVPCCLSCNSSKSGFTIIEWRTGRRLGSMSSTVTHTPRCPRMKPQRVPPQCTQCGADCPTGRRRYCSEACAYARHVEQMRHRMRNAYRTSVGIPLDTPVRGKVAVF